MTALPKTLFELIAYVVSDDARTANAAKLLNKVILALIVIGATVVAVVVLVQDKASLLQLGLSSGAMAVAAAAVAWLKSQWRRRKSRPIEQPVGVQAGDQHDGGSDDHTAPAERRTEKDGHAGGKDSGGAVVENAERPKRRRADRRAIPK